MASEPNSTLRSRGPLLSKSKNTALGISVLPFSSGARAGASARATPMAEFEVPKSNPQAIMHFPFRREGDLIYRDAPGVARLFVFAYAAAGSWDVRRTSLFILSPLSTRAASDAPLPSDFS